VQEPHSLNERRKRLQDKTAEAMPMPDCSSTHSVSILPLLPNHGKLYQYILTSIIRTNKPRNESGFDGSMPWPVTVGKKEKQSLFFHL
jgi:hypothetical protein